MAKIEDIGAYPNQSPVTLADYLIGTDAATKATKTFTIQDIADALDEQVTLQEVLNASDPGTVPPLAIATGSIQLTGDFTLDGASSDFFISGGQIAATSGNDLTLITKSDTNDIRLLAGNASGTLEGSGAGLDFQFSGNAVLSSDGDITLNGIQNTSNISVRAGDKAIISANGSSYGAQPAGSVMLYNQNDDIIVNANGGQITIGGTFPSRPTGLDLGPIDGDIDIWAFSAGSKINLTANGGIDSLSTHNFIQVADFKSNGGFLLDGAAGTVGDIVVSQGPGSPLAWQNVSDLTVGAVVSGVHISAASTLANFLPGTPVFVSNTPSGPNNYPTVDYAFPSPTVKMPAIGLIVTATAKGNDAEIIMSGELEVDTNSIRGAASINDVVYVDVYDAVTSPLCLTVNRPDGATTEVQNVGVITKVGANGSMKVSAIGRSNDLPNIAANELWAGNASGVAEAQNALTVDVANATVNVGNGRATSNTLMDTKINAQVVYGDAAGVIGTQNLQYGVSSLVSAQAASQQNTAIGVSALQNLTTGSSNVALGHDAGLAVITTNNNIAIGDLALDGADVGNEVVAIGGGAVGNTTSAFAASTVAVGHNALNSLTSGANNTALGHSVGFAITNGQRNVFVGGNANGTAGSDSDMVVLGYNASGAGDCVAIGVSAEGGNYSVAIGRESNAGVPADNSTALGAVTQADVDCIALGKDAIAVQRLGNPMLAITPLIAQALANAFVFPDNNAAVAAGLVPGDAYCVDLAPAGIPAPGGAGGPAVLAFVY